MRAVGLVQLASRIEHSGRMAVASILFFTASLVLGLAPLAALLGERAAGGLQAACLAGTYCLSGLPQAVSSVALAAGGGLDTHVLMSLAVLATLYLGMVQEGALLLLLFQISHFLEERFTSRAQGSMERLWAAMPERATLVALEPVPAGASAAAGINGSSTGSTGGSGTGSSSGGPDLSSCREVLADSVAVGQLVLVRAGEQLPLDGEVVWGVASVSQAHISGESQPARVAEGAWLPAGALSHDGALVLRVTALAGDSTPARMARMAAQAQASKPQLTRLLDRVGALWSRGVVAATLTALAVLLAAGVPLLEAPGGALYRALGVLVAGSPCAVVLVPLAYVCSMAAVTRRGVLLKGASALDALADVRTVALDKTGTITTGELRLTEALLLPVLPPVLPGADGEAAAAAPAPGQAGAAAVASDATRTAGSLSLIPLIKQAADDAAAAAASGAGGGLSAASSLSTSLSASLESPTSGSDLEEAPPPPPLAEADWAELAARCAAALSRASTHPVSRAVVSASGRLARGVAVSGVEVVAGSGVRGVCRLRGSAGAPAAEAAAAAAPAAAAAWAAAGRSFAVSFGSADFAVAALGGEGSLAARRLRWFLSGSSGSMSVCSIDSSGAPAPADAAKAISVLVMAPVVSPRGGGGGTGAGGAAEAAGEARVAVFSFEDVVRPGVAEAVAALQDGSWRRGGTAAGATPEVAAAKRVVMLTGDNPTVAAAVAAGVGISHFRSAMLPADKLAFVQAEQAQSGAAAAAAAAKAEAKAAGRSRGSRSADTTASTKATTTTVGTTIAASASAPSGSGGHVLMMGDGINDAPALAAARVGVAVASSPRDLVAAASDVIVLNGQGAAALPWLLRSAHSTQVVVRQNLTLALVAMAAATLPTVAGFFPLWLAVTLHEGSTLAVALNSLRLLLPTDDEQQQQQAASEAGNGGSRRGSSGGMLAGAVAVWKGLCELMSDAPDGHGHSHGHSHGHGCCGGHSHDHGHRHDHSHSHAHDHDHDHHHHHGHDHGADKAMGVDGNGSAAHVECCSQHDHDHGHHHDHSNQELHDHTHDHDHGHEHGHDDHKPEHGPDAGEAAGRASRSASTEQGFVRVAGPRDVSAGAAVAHGCGGLSTALCCGGRGWHGGIRLGPLSGAGCCGMLAGAVCDDGSGCGLGGASRMRRRRGRGRLLAAAAAAAAVKPPPGVMAL
eukprot:XP_001697106.1 heavy metal transporting ATPase [Chlamydomonas reinhardtii]